MRAILVVLSMVAGGGKTPAPSDFTIPALPDLPKADNLQAAPSDERKLDTPTADVPKREYEVVKVSHAQSFEARGDSVYPPQGGQRVRRGEPAHGLARVLHAGPGEVTSAGRRPHRAADRGSSGARGALQQRDAGLWRSADLRLRRRLEPDRRFEQSGDYVVEVKVDGKPISKSPLPIRHELQASISETQATPALKAALVPTQPTTGGKTDPAAPDPYDVTR